MQTTTNDFKLRANKSVRWISWIFEMDFDKTFNGDYDFFTIGESSIGGSDIIGNLSENAGGWNFYSFTDYTDRLISVEWSREQDPFSSVTSAICDIVLDNHDDFFTPGEGSIIDGNILPSRPVRLSAGFKNENVQVFLGLNEKMPTIDENNKTVTFHCIDAFSAIFNKPLDETIVMTDVTTDTVLIELFDQAGLAPSEYNLDTAFNVIRFLYFPKGMKILTAISQLMEAEMGRIYMDEMGTVQFKNRQNVSDTTVWSFSPNNIVAIDTPKQDDIVNVVEVKSQVRAVQPNQKVWELSSPVVVKAGETLDVWADFQDPVTEHTDPIYSNLPIVTSFFKVNTAEDGTGSTSDSDVTLQSSYLFTQSLLLTFENTGATDYYLTNIVVFGTPAKVVQRIYVREEDATSVGKYGEQVKTIDNDFIQREDEAYSKAIIFLDEHSEYGDIRAMEVKGNPALQLGDAIELTSAGVTSDQFVVTRIYGSINDGRFTQRLAVKQMQPANYFTIGESLIGGTDIIAP